MPSASSPVLSMVAGFLGREGTCKPGNLDPDCVIQVFLPRMDGARDNQGHSKEAGPILLR